MRVALIIAALGLPLSGCSTMANIMETEYVHVRSSGSHGLAVMTSKLASGIQLGCGGAPTTAVTNVRASTYVNTNADRPEQQRLDMESNRQCDRR